MANINPETLRDLRRRRGWSLDQLAEKSLVNKASIHRIERGKRTDCRSLTVQKLAAALQVEPERLAEGPDETRALEVSRKSQMNIRMADDARNALTLVAQRYDVKQSSILHLAPLLFVLAAEGSLKARKRRLEELGERIAAVEAQKGFDHLDGLLTYNSRGEDVFEAERRSITARDIFGRLIPDEHIRFDYEESEQNPMARFLAERVEDLGGLVAFEHWSPHWDQPGYTLGREEAAELVGGDADAVGYIVDGVAPLHEMPKAVREGGPSDVAEWAKQLGADWEAVREAEFARMLEMFRETKATTNVVEK